MDTSVLLARDMARLSAGETSDFPRLAPYQAQAWHQFLVQLAAIALDRAGVDSLPTDAETWRRLLLALTNGAVEPWTLVVDDLSKPAFLQPPVSENTLADFRGPFMAPDERCSSMLVMSKNFDVKSGRLSSASAEHWIYALVALQTQQGYSNPGDYGICRMNTGYGSRPCFGLTPGASADARFRRDVAVMLETFHEPYLGRRDGCTLLWIEPWIDARPYRLDELHPGFIEVCRKIRMNSADGMICFYAKTTKGRRIAAEDQKGNVGDAWIPVALPEGKALTVSQGGLHYRLLHRVLFSSDFSRSAAMMPRADELEDIRMVAQVLVRGDGKTEGLHERAVPFPTDFLARFRDRDPTLAERSEAQIGDAAEMQRVLNRALCVYVQGAPAKADFTDRRPRAWLDRYDGLIDGAFFDHLWRSLRVPPDDAPIEWQRFLRDTARKLLDEAFGGLPAPAARHYRALTSADAVFAAGWRKQLTRLVEHEAKRVAERTEVA